jgi:hypothetical protein
MLCTIYQPYVSFRVADLSALVRGGYASTKERKALTFFFLFTHDSKTALPQ